MNILVFKFKSNLLLLMNKIIYKRSLYIIFFLIKYICDYMRKRYIFIGIFILFIIGVTLIGTFIVMGNNKVKREKDIFVIQSNKEVYFNSYGYDIDNPNIIINPYGNSPLTALVCFSTNDYSEVSITIKGKYDNDINYTFSSDKYHLIPIYGLYADYDNIVIIRSENKEKIVNIKTNRLPDDFKYQDNMNYVNYSFYNVNYPYAIDSYGDVRWYLNDNYYGNITLIDNSNIIIGSNRYTEEDSTISIYKMNLLGKIYNEYLLKDSYYGINSVKEDNIIIKSNKYLELDMQTGNVINKYKDYDESNINNIYNLYTGTKNYKIVKGNRFGSLRETEKQDDNTLLLKYKKYKGKNISIKIDSDRIKVENDTDDVIYVILDKFLDKRIYDVTETKYINLEGLKGKYNVYYKIEDKIYKTDYYIEV